MMFPRCKKGARGGGDLGSGVRQVVQPAHHAPQLAELVLRQAGLVQGPLRAAVLGHAGHVLQVHPLAPLQVVHEPGVVLVQLAEGLLDALRGGIREELLVNLQNRVALEMVVCGFGGCGGL